VGAVGAVGAAVLLLTAAPGWAQTAQEPAIDDLHLVLARLADTDDPGGCRATLNITTTGPATLATFSVRLVLFDPNGAALRTLSVLAMPVAPTQPTIATFPTGEDTCAGIGAFQVLGFPLCADGDGRSLACAGAARTDSRVEGVPFGGP
jgi:hypothetical protein